MAARLDFNILPQPDDTTCGPTCLHAVYRYYGDHLDLQQVVAECGSLEGGGTLAVLLALHAMKRGYSARIYTFNLNLFDPSWFVPQRKPDLRRRLEEQAKVKDAWKLQVSTEAYLEFLDRGGDVRFRDLSAELIREYLKAGRPILTGLSATYLYHASREIPDTNAEDDIRGEPVGHFVVLAGYDKEHRHALVFDPLHDNPGFRSQCYEVTLERLMGAITLGAITYDSNLLILEPPKGAAAPAASPRS